MNRALKELVLAQLREYLREPEVLFWTLGFPIMVASVLGLLYSFKPDVVYKAALVESPAQESLSSGRYTPDIFKEKEIIIPGKSSRRIKIIKMSPAEAQKSYQGGMVEIIVEVKKDRSVHYAFDPANERAESLYLWIEHAAQQKTVGVKSGLKSEVVPMEQRGSRYIDYLVPGLIALGIMNATLWGIGWTLIEFRIKKFLRRMVVTPMRKIDFMLSISLTRLSLSVLEASILYLFAFYAFGVKMKGSLGVFLLLFISGHIAFSGLSILLASRTNNTRVGNGLINVITMPMFLLSGVFFSYHSFPDWMISVVQYLPLTILADSMRDVFLFGAGLGKVGFEVIYLSVFGVVFYVLGLKVYRWY